MHAVGGVDIMIRFSGHFAICCGGKHHPLPDSTVSTAVSTMMQLEIAGLGAAAMSA